MNKSKFIYILLIGIISLFSFQMNVYADLASEAKTKSCEQLISEGILDTKSESILFDGSGYDANCVYAQTKSKGFGILKPKEYSCVIFQVAFGTESDPGIYQAKHISKAGDPIGLYYTKYKDKKWYEFYKPSEMNFPIEKAYFAGLNKVCPMSVQYEDICPNRENVCEALDYFILSSSNPTMNRIHETDIPLEIPPLIVEGDPSVQDCSTILGDTGIKIFKIIKTILAVVVPIILLVMGSLDFAKAVFASDENNIKKAQGTFIKRVIICFVIFLIPSVLKFILEIAKVVWPVIDTTLCGIL